MATAYCIHYVRRSEIDSKKWNDCVSASVNSLIYGHTQFLDAMADNWDGIIINDYTAVMPLPWRKKYFIKYLYQPAFIQQLGLFYKENIPPFVWQDLFKMLQSRYRFVDINVNSSNEKLALLCSPLVERNNYVLDVQNQYVKIASGYKKNFKKNLLKAKRTILLYNADYSFEMLINKFKNEQQPKSPHVTNFYFDQLINLAALWKEKKQLVVRTVSNKEGTLLAGVMLFKENRRLYNIVSYTSKAGRNCEANYFLYDSLIKEMCGENSELDFEGSDISSIAFFYKSFGAVNKVYFKITYNAIPFYNIIRKKMQYEN
ncbi:MAG: hypothetical protein RIR12_855 [Bacteroidota bacterium]|jgi:hypothetical protein